LHSLCTCYRDASQNIIIMIAYTISPIQCPYSWPFSVRTRDDLFEEGDRIKVYFAHNCAQNLPNNVHHRASTEREQTPSSVCIKTMVKYPILDCQGTKVSVGNYNYSVIIYDIRCSSALFPVDVGPIEPNRSSTEVQLKFISWTKVGPMSAGNRANEPTTSEPMAGWLCTQPITDVGPIRLLSPAQHGISHRIRRERYIEHDI
jgi:hypothetical protein